MQSHLEATNDVGFFSGKIDFQIVVAAAAAAVVVAAAAVVVVNEDWKGLLLGFFDRSFQRVPFASSLRLMHHDCDH